LQTLLLKNYLEHFFFDFLKALELAKEEEEAEMRRKEEEAAKAKVAAEAEAARLAEEAAKVKHLSKDKTKLTSVHNIYISD